MGNAGGLRSAGQRGNKGGEIGKTVIASSIKYTLKKKKNLHDFTPGKQAIQFKNGQRT